QAIFWVSGNCCCATSRRINPERPALAKYLDILALEPVSPQYQLWLDFGKWMTLPPDRCSVLTYAEHPEELASAVGSELPIVPAEIQQLVGAAAP
ncbi:MAG TPA: hypothetical protein PK867_02660, partial [Pirellulales bacterium]|nr:hypothetical protein [Pirellulales bacterium]